MRGFETHLQEIHHEISALGFGAAVHTERCAGAYTPEVLEAGSRQGRWGLTGMRERADKIRGRLEIWTRNSAGTEVELRVPGTFAYRQASLRTSWLLRVVSGQWRNSQS